MSSQPGARAEAQRRRTEVAVATKHAPRRVMRARSRENSREQRVESNCASASRRRARELDHRASSRTWRPRMASLARQVWALVFSAEAHAGGRPARLHDEQHGLPKEHWACIDHAPIIGSFALQAHRFAGTGKAAEGHCGHTTGEGSQDQPRGCRGSSKGRWRIGAQKRVRTVEPLSDINATTFSSYGTIQPARQAEIIRRLSERKPSSNAQSKQTR